MTRRVPADLAERLEQRVGRGAAPRSSAATSPPSSASPTSRCSVETYSSPSSLGALALGRDDHGQQRPGDLRRGDGGAAGAGQAGQLAPRRCARDGRGVGADGLQQRRGGAVGLLEQREQQVQRARPAGCPSAAARRTAADNPSWLLRVVMSIVCHPSVSASRPSCRSRRLPRPVTRAATAQAAGRRGRDRVHATRAQLGQPGRDRRGWTRARARSARARRAARLQQRVDLSSRSSRIRLMPARLTPSSWTAAEPRAAARRRASSSGGRRRRSGRARPGRAGRTRAASAGACRPAGRPPR